MSFIKDYLEIIKKDLEYDDLILLTSSPQGELNEEEDILSKLLKAKIRIIRDYQIEYINFRIVARKSGELTDNVLYFSIKEYPSCCGKLILYSISISPSFYIKYPDGHIHINGKKMNNVVEHTIDFVKKICERLDYSSFDFIISNVEQPKILEAINEMGLKPIAQFQNSRNRFLHTCYSYSIKVLEPELKPATSIS